MTTFCIDPIVGNMDYIKENFTEILAKYKHEAVLISISFVIASISLLLFLLNQSTSSGAPTIQISDNKSSKDSPSRQIYVDVSGAVNEPGVYPFNSGTRLIEVLKEANGLAKDADKIFFHRNFNMAREVKDGEKIYIPYKEETHNTPLQANASSRNSFPAVLGESSKLLNINTATLEELDALSGIGNITAEKIVSNRPYNAIEELLTKKVLKKNVYEDHKDKFTLN